MIEFNEFIQQWSRKLSLSKKNKVTKEKGRKPWKSRRLSTSTASSSTARTANPPNASKAESHLSQIHEPAGSSSQAAKIIVEVPSPMENDVSVCEDYILVPNDNSKRRSLSLNNRSSASSIDLSHEDICSHAIYQAEFLDSRKQAEQETEDLQGIDNLDAEKQLVSPTSPDFQPAISETAAAEEKRVQENRSLFDPGAQESAFRRQVAAKPTEVLQSSTGPENQMSHRDTRFSQATTNSNESLEIGTLSQEDEIENLREVVRNLLKSKTSLDKLRVLRQRSLGLRASLQSQRTILKEKERGKDVADNLFMKYIRETPPPISPTSLPNEQTTLEKHYAELQHTRDEYGSALEECVLRTEVLDDVEFEMGRIEEHLYKILFGDIPEDANLASDFSRAVTKSDSPSSPSPWLGLVAGVQDRFEPLQTQYLSRLGDWDLGRERLGNMERELEDLLALKESLLSAGRELRDDLRANLEDLPLEIAQLQQEILEIREDVERIRKECIDQGIELDDGSDDGSGLSLSVYEEDT